MASTAAPPATRPGLSRSASVIVTSRRPSLRLATTPGSNGGDGDGNERRRARPITFALPPSAPSHDASAKSPHSSPPSPSTTSFLNRITRKLSQSRTQLVRRVSIGKNNNSGGGGKNAASSSPSSPVKTRADGEADKENVGLAAPTRPGMGKRSSSHTPSTSSALARAARAQAAEAVAPSSPHSAAAGEAAPPAPAAAAGAPLKRGLRVSTVMRRTKSEAKRRGRILNEEGKMDELVRRTEDAAGGEGAQGDQAGEAAGKEERGKETPAVGGRRGDWEEVHSSMGSYFWSDSLGVCWDGREKVHPDLLFSFQPYSSNSDVLPPAHPHQQHQHHQPHRPSPPPPQQQHRIVYASTLSSFPPRPPLRPRTPEMTEASKIIAEYRALHGTMTPSLRGEPLDTVPPSEEDTPRPDEGHQAATPAEREPQEKEEVESAEPTLLALKSSTSTVRPRPSFATLPAASNPFASPSPSAVPLPPSPALSSAQQQQHEHGDVFLSASSASSASPSPLLHAHAPFATRSFSPTSLRSGNSAYSTPTSEPNQFHFQSQSDREDGGESADGHGDGDGEGRGRGGEGAARMSSEGSATSLESMARGAAGCKP
ncbi:hypothetical protein JCM6882_009237 [Rhodosporidiobolus microsporus]